MTPVVYLHEQQLHALPRKPNQPVPGIAYTWDSNTVIHAYTNSPSVHPAGAAADCDFLFSENAFNDIENHVAKLSLAGFDAKLKLLVFFSEEKNALAVKAFVKTESAVVECAVKWIPEKSALYSRSKGLLETDALAKKSVGIVGLGSGGAPIAVELAKAGVGNFVLIDFDRLELSNVARHVCGINDLGRYKTFAVRDAVLQKNPYAEIKTLEADVTQERDMCAEALSTVDVIIAASDNDRSRFFINEVALRYKIPAVFGRAITRATGGDVMRVRPFEGPCYSCLYSQNVRPEGSDDEEISQEEQAKKLLPEYTSEKELQAAIQVGLASDIAPISNFMVKLALVELSRGLDSGIKSLEEDFIADFYIWANRRENIYANWSRLEFNFNKPSILRWYGAKVSRDPLCMVCGD